MGADHARVAHMLKGRRDIRVLPFPGIPDSDEDIDIVEVGVRVLLDDEVDAGRLEATQYLIGKAKAMRIDYGLLIHSDPELLQREITRQLIFRAFVQPLAEEDDGPWKGKHKPFFPSVQGVRQLDAVLVETLDEIYDDQQNYVNPLIGLDDVAIKELADTLGEGRGGEVILNSCDAPTLRTLVRFMAVQLSSLQPGK